MRLWILADNKFYYDIGLRKDDTKLSKTQELFGEMCPRFLEDFIEKYGKKKIKVLDYGTIEDTEYIDELLR